MLSPPPAAHRRHLAGAGVPAFDYRSSNPPTCCRRPPIAVHCQKRAVYE